jgi:Zn-dependent M28 family amino/carboxypeptidase
MQIQSAALLCFCLLTPAQESKAKTGGAPSITKQEIRAHVTYLASNELEGREAGTPGGRKAAAYIAKVFRESGLKPIKGAKGYLQPFESEGWKTENVLGYLEGSDPTLKHELIIVGAHYDHLGRDPQSGAIYNGADDDASGTSVMLEVAQAFGQAKQAPKRSLLFMAFGAEEKGLLGSKHYVANPLHPLQQTKWMVNLEMMGRGDKGQVTIMMLEGLPDPILEAVAGAGVDVDLEMVDGGKAHIGSGDQYPFYQQNIPILCFYGGENHPDYHQPTDTADKIDAPWMEQVGRMVYLSTLACANAAPVAKPAPTAGD